MFVEMVAPLPDSVFVCLPEGSYHNVEVVPAPEVKNLISSLSFSPMATLLEVNTTLLNLRISEAPTFVLVLEVIVPNEVSAAAAST